VCDAPQAPEDLAAHCAAHFDRNEQETPLAAEVKRPRERLDCSVAEHLQGGGGGGEATLRRALTADPTVIDLTGQQPLPKRSRSGDIGYRRQVAKVNGDAELYDSEPRGTSLMDDLLQCLSQQEGNFTAVVAADTLHYQSERPDAGWGCGYRNCQMLLSSLLNQPDLAGALFRGAGEVPAIAALQLYIEEAWVRGWDRAGAKQLGMQLRGATTWIGTTEIAALLRASRVRARIVDFEGGAAQVEGGEWQSACIYGALPRDAMPGSSQEVHPTVECDGCGMFPVRGPCFSSQLRDNYDLCYECHSKGLARGNDPYCRRQGRLQGADHNAPAIMRWVWAYFADGCSGHQENIQAAPNGDGASKHPPSDSSQEAGDSESDDAHQPVDDRSSKVLQSKKPPLYFQHKGHSRTIVGIEKWRKANGNDEHFLIILDPTHRTADIRRALRNNRSWQKLLKRGEKTLGLSEYQILYADPGLAESEDEIEKSKIIAAVERF